VAALPISIAGAYLLTTGPEGPVALPGIGLTIDQIGVTVLKPDGQVGAVMSWTELVSLDTTERSRTPDGRPAVVVLARGASKDHRFVVPSAEPAELEAAISSWSALCSDRGAPVASQRRVSPVLVGLLAIVVAGAVAVLLLASAGVLKL
jgi:hypothetical protein